MNLKFQETMKKYLNHILALFIALTALSSCSDDNEPSPVPEPDPTPSGYCLMFYMSGDDKIHDITLMESARQAAAVSDENVAVTVLHKTPVKEKAKRTTVRTVTPRRMAF